MRKKTCYRIRSKTESKVPIKLTLTSDGFNYLFIFIYVLLFFFPSYIHSFFLSLFTLYLSRQACRNWKWSKAVYNMFACIAITRNVSNISFCIYNIHLSLSFLSVSLLSRQACRNWKRTKAASWMYPASLASELPQVLLRLQQIFFVINEHKKLYNVVFRQVWRNWGRARGTL